MIELSIQPLQWAMLPELHDVPDLDDSDLACMGDLQAVLARHGKLTRFAIHLAHRHFDLAADEVLVERQEPDERSQRITVGNVSDVAGARPTTWLFADHPGLSLSDAVYCVCVADPSSTGACIRHARTRSPGERDQREDRVKHRRISEDRSRYEQGFPTGGHDPNDRSRGR